jgi:hypothetical protein
MVLSVAALKQFIVHALTFFYLIKTNTQRENPLVSLKKSQVHMLFLLPHEATS